MANPEPLSDYPFEYQALKNGKVLIFWYGKQVMILTGQKALKFLADVNGVTEADEQLVMARITGNFKRGNEKDNKQRD